MGRNIDSGLMAAMSAGVLRPAFFAMLTFRSGVEWVWTGVGPITVDAQTYKGVGSLATIGSIVEGLDVQAAGTTVGLSGIDSALLSESLNDVKSGAPAKIWFGAFSGTTLIARYVTFSGVIDKPELTQSPETNTISLSLETRLIDFGRATMRRYTSGDQNVLFPTDSAFNSVEIQSNIALNWGA
jgi:hypothetical protein